MCFNEGSWDGVVIVGYLVGPVSSGSLQEGLTAEEKATPHWQLGEKTWCDLFWTSGPRTVLF